MARITKGLERAEEIAEEQRSSGFYRIKSYFMKDGDVVYLRYLTPMAEMITADTHSYCATKPKPAEYKGDKWPEHMPAVCQLDRMFRIYGEDDQPTDEFEDGYGDCFIHNRDRGKVREGKFKKDLSTPDTQTYSLAVVREPILDPATNKPIGFRDATDEFKQEDTTIRKIPRIVVISQKHRNYWSAVDAAMFMGGDVRGQDFRVSRKENDYTFVGLGQDPGLNPETESWKRYEEALELVGYNLEEDILKQASPDWYARWFDPSKTPEGGYGRQEDAEETAEVAQEAAVSPADAEAATARAAALRDQMLSARS